MADAIRALDATDQTQVLVAVQTWINGLQDPTTKASILPERVTLEYTEGTLGYCIKGQGGAVFEEDILGGFEAEVPFAVYFTTSAVPDSAGEITRPLERLAAWFRANGTAGLTLGDRRTPLTILTAKGATDLNGKDELGNTTFFSVFVLTYEETPA